MAIIIMGAKSRPDAVYDKLADLTDGTAEVVAVEIFDHPNAERVTNGATFGGDGGPTTLGVWYLGPSDEVYARIEAGGFESYDEQHAIGGA